MQRGRSVKRRIMAWVLSLVMVASVIMVPAGKVEAAGDVTLDIGSQVTIADDNGNIDINIDKPAGYSTLQEVINAGYTKLQVQYSITSFSAAASGTPGIQLYYSHGSEWEYVTGGWKVISAGDSGVLELDFSSSSVGKTDELKRFGAQIAHVSTASYSITSAKLVFTGTSSGGTGTETKTDNPGESVEGMSVSYSIIKEYSSDYREYSVTISNNTGESVTGVEVILNTSGESSAQVWKSELSASYDADVNGVRYFYSGTIADGESKTFNGDYKIGLGKAITAAYVNAINCSKTVVTDNNLDLELEYNYAKLLQYSLYLYDANMCGTDVDESSALSWRGDCHTGDSSVTKTINGTTYTIDVSGGYHDAGDHVKFGLPQAYAASVLGLGYAYFGEAYDELGQTSHLQMILKRFADYFEKCTITDASDNVVAFCYQVGDGGSDHDYWGPAEQQEASTGERDQYVLLTSPSAPCTDIVAESAAALAIYAANFSDYDNASYLDCAKKLVAYAESMSMDASGNAPGTGGFYSGSSYSDDLALACIWIHNAIGESDTVYKAKYDTYVEGCKDGWLLSWDDVSAAAYLAGGSKYTGKITNIMSSKMAKDVTPQGFTCVDGTWGSARYNTALQFTGMTYDKLFNKSSYTQWSETQMQYLLGNNDTKQCYVIGYNENDPKHPHHRTASGYTGSVGAHALDPMAHTLYGALAGGPDASDGYVDKADVYQYSEVALDYNAAFVGAAAALYMQHREDADQTMVTSGLSEVTRYYTEGVTITTISFADKKISMKKGDDKQLNVSVTPNDAAVSWESSDVSVATVDNMGNVTAIGKGSAIITATANGKKATCTVTVTVPLTELVLKKGEDTVTNCSMEKGDVVTISDTGSPDIMVVPIPEDADHDEITLSSDKPSVVSVDNTTHEIKALSKGNANITVASGEITRLYAVSVIVTPDSIELDENDLSLTTKSGENTYTLTATVGPEDATYEASDISWSVDNDEVITIEQDEDDPAKAVVKAVNKGSAVVTASLSVPGIAEPIKASCNITVSTPVDSVDIVQEAVTLLTTEGKNTAQLTANITPSDATDVTITWVSSDTKVATVDKNGKVTAVGKGEAVITGKVGKKEDTCTVTVVKPITAIAITDGKGNEVETRTMAKGTSETMSVKVTPSDATDADKIVWSLKSGDGIVSVDAGTGEVTALAKGTAEVQVTVGEEVSGINNIKTAAYTITVSNIITAVSLKDKNDKTESSVEKGTELVLTAAFTPDDEDVDEPGITWESSAPGLVSVTPDESKKTTATVKAINPTDGKAVTITLTVTPAADADPIVKEYKLTVTKMAQEAPVISEIKALERTTDSITVSVTPVQEDKAYEYSVDGGKSWVDSSKITKISDTTSKITGLSEATGYNVVVRFAGDANHEPSPVGKTSDGKTAAVKTGTLIAVTDPYIINVGRLPGGTGYNDADELKDAYVNALYISDDGTANGRVAAAEYDNGRLTLYPGRNYKLVGSNDKLIISYKEDETSSEASEDKSTITLDNATIKNVDVKATVKVAGNTTVEGDIKADNVEVADTAEVVNVKGDVNADNVNVAAGTGTVKVAGKISADNVEISSGTVTVDEGIKASSDVTITGGTVAATGDKDTAAIEADKINISSGTVNATGTNGGAAIKGDTVTVSGGDVTATGKDEGSTAITGSTVELSGGTISATGGAGASAVEAAETITIGSSVKLSVNTLKKSDGTVASAISSKAITIEENAEIKADENAKADLFNVTPTDANGVAVDITKYTGKTEELVVPQPKDDKGKTETTTPAGQGSTEAQTPQPVKATDMTVTANVKGVTSASLSGTYQLALKKSLTVAVSFSPENAVSETITVTSSNPKVVAVNGTKLTAKKVGTAKITVTSENGLTKTFSVKVMKKAVSKIKLKAAKKTVKAGKTLKLKTTITPSKKKAGNKLYWSSSDDSIATVTDKGVVKGVKKGKVKITATALDGSGKKATVKITVK